MSGLADKVSGNIKQVVGDVTDNDKLKAEGKLEEVQGDVKSKVSEVENHVSDMIDDIKDDKKPESPDAPDAGGNNDKVTRSDAP